jgi:hypothetical protein
MVPSEAIYTDAPGDPPPRLSIKDSPIFGAVGQGGALRRREILLASERSAVRTRAGPFFIIFSVFLLFLSLFASLLLYEAVGEWEQWGWVGAVQGC